MADGTIARLNVAVQADSSRFKRGLDDAKRSAGGFAASLKGIGIAAIIAGATAALYKYQQILSETGAEIDSLAKSASRLGATVAQLQRLQFLGEQTGVEVNALRKALQKLQEGSSDAANGTGEAVKAFQELGVNAERFNGLGLEEKLILLSRGFKELATDADRVRVATDLFGARGAGLVVTLNAGEQAIREMLNQQQRMGTITQEQAAGVEAANDAWNRFGKSIEHVKHQVGAFGAEFRAQLFNEWSTFLEIQSGARDSTLQFNDAEIESAKALAQTNMALERRNKLMEDRKRRYQEEQARLKAVNEAAYRLDEQLSLQRETFGQSPLEQQIRGLERQGANQHFIEGLRYQAKQIAALEEQKKAQDKLRDSMQQMVDKAKELGKAQIDPAEEYKQQLLDLLALQKSGTVDVDTLMRAEKRLQKNFIAARTSAAGVPTGSVGSLNASVRGSAAAFEAIDRANKGPQQQLLKVQQEAKNELKTINKNLVKQIQKGEVTIQEVTI